VNSGTKIFKSITTAIAVKKYAILSGLTHKKTAEKIIAVNRSLPISPRTKDLSALLGSAVSLPIRQAMNPLGITQVKPPSNTEYAISTLIKSKKNAANTVKSNWTKTIRYTWALLFTSTLLSASLRGLSIVI
jgi:hypothetical protein